MQARVLRARKSLISQYVRRSRELSRVGGSVLQVENERWPAFEREFEWAFEAAFEPKASQAARGEILQVLAGLNRPAAILVTKRRGTSRSPCAPR
jgi:hypothetical protein